MAIRITEQDGGVRIAVKVVPGASRNRIVGALGDTLKVAVSKPPQDGAANAAVIALLAEAFGVPRKDVSIVKGHAQPRKEVFLSRLTATVARQRLAAIG
jgi:uncharacterized protein (TIGR00251 family)